MYKLLASLLIITFIYLQVRLWFGEGGVIEMIALREKIEQQRNEHDRLYQRNKLLANTVIELHSGLETIEEVARYELGMIGHGETFYLIYD